MAAEGSDFDLKKVEQPILFSHLPSREVKETFLSLFDAAYRWLDTEDEEIIEQRAATLCQRIEYEVALHPILAKTVDENMWKWSLLTTICEKSYSRSECHDAMKILIRANPISLLWRWGDRLSEPSTPIKAIAEYHPTLFLWIAQHFPMVFDHRRCVRDPPHLHMVHRYANDHVEASLVQQFYELYPAGLEQKQSYFCPHAGYALQRAIVGWEQECDADLFIWMASQNPKALSFRDVRGSHVLHMVCMHLAQTVDDEVDAPFQCSENMLRICRFIVDKCPNLVYKKGRGGGGLPLHQLAKCCNRPLVQQAVMLLLKQYPEAVEVRAKSYLPDLEKEPFIQEICPLVVAESGLSSGKEFVIQGCDNLTAATASLSPNHLLSRATDIFASWVDDYKTGSLQRLPAMIQSVCQKFEGPDVDDEEDEDTPFPPPEPEEEEEFDDSSCSTDLYNEEDFDESEDEDENLV